jgi:hypothetical protein
VPQALIDIPFGARSHAGPSAEHDAFIPEALRAASADRYDVERELGRGGMATVYLARDRKHGRQFALKVLRPDLVSTLGAGRFLREIAIAAHLVHPHILTLIDSGETATGGFLHYVMPFAEGESPRDMLTRDGPFKVSEAIRLLREVAEALAYAHGQGVVHRDTAEAAAPGGGRVSCIRRMRLRSVLEALALRAPGCKGR